MTRHIFGLVVLGTLSLILAGCGPTKLDKALSRLDNRPDWHQFGKLDVPRHPAEKYLEGWVIVLDPGHGGDAHLENYKRGPTGVREAEMNWRVGVLLERLLTDAGVHVTMTRHGDEDVSLKDRAEVANNVERPDGGRGRTCSSACTTTPRRARSANFSSVWYHGEADWSGFRWTPPNTSPTTWVHRCGPTSRSASPLMSDQLMYAGGFGVLRQCNVPALLCESSFFTNLAEEQRLRDASSNLR
ncbi:MAG: N-acetylmuramoyl-L-alanine amidase [Phycisphaerales bacterium]